MRKSTLSLITSPIFLLLIIIIIQIVQTVGIRTAYLVDLFSKKNSEERIV